MQKSNKQVNCSHSHKGYVYTVLDADILITGNIDTWKSQNIQTQKRKEERSRIADRNSHD